MKRDMDLIRTIMLAMEEDAQARPGRPNIAGYDKEIVGHHMELLKGAGFVDSPDMNFLPGGAKIRLSASLTWQGHEFLETMRDPDVWDKTKAGAKKVGHWSMSLLAELGKAYVKEKALKLGLPL